MLAWLTTHTLHQHIFYSNLFDISKHPSAAHFNTSVCLIFIQYKLRKRVHCPLSTKHILSTYLIQRLPDIKTMTYCRISFVNVSKHLQVNSINLNKVSLLIKNIPSFCLCHTVTQSHNIWLLIIFIPARKQDSKNGFIKFHVNNLQDDLFWYNRY